MLNDKFDLSKLSEDCGYFQSQMNWLEKQTKQDKLDVISHIKANEEVSIKEQLQQVEAMILSQIKQK